VIALLILVGRALALAFRGHHEVALENLVWFDLSLRRATATSALEKRR
jgi:hypothetical protein